MSEFLEIEFKNLLTKDEYDQLIHHFKIPTNAFFTQENIYFDTPHYMLENIRAALRIRIKGEKYELTLKEEAEEGILETNQHLTNQEALEIIHTNTIKHGVVYDKLLQLIKQADEPIVLVEIARIKTKRATIPYKEQELFLDVSTYFNHTDYELELEAKEYHVGKQIFSDLLKQFEIPKRPSKPKIVRARKLKKSTLK